MFTGSEDRQHAYVALSRGAEVNLAYVFTVSPKLADPMPGPRPAPELARYDRRAAGPAAQPDPATAIREALAVLADVLDRDGQQRSASQIRNQALSDADHMALLHAIWAAETTPARHRRYQDLLMATLPPGYRTEPGHQARWLWRTLHTAELADLDPGRVLAEAVGERDLAGARDVPAVIDARLRYRLGTPVPLPAAPWSAQVPQIADPGRRAYIGQIAALMDARKDRIGEYAAEHTPPWAVTALGPVPAHPLDRLDWQRRAASIGAWQELSGHQHPADPIGPEPVAAVPDLRAAWHEAFAALRPTDRPDVRGMPDGLLCHLRDTYPTETAWAPPYVGDELRQVRTAARDARLAGLRRRHPGQHHPPLRSAEPQPAADAQHDQLTPAVGQPPGEMPSWVKEVAAAHRTFAERLADRQSLGIPSHDPDYGDLGPAFPSWPGQGKDAILQPPKPEIPPSAEVLQRVAGRDADWEAAD